MGLFSPAPRGISSMRKKTATTAREVVLQFLWRPTSEARRRQNLSWGLSALPARGICLTCLRMARNEKDQRRGARCYVDDAVCSGVCNRFDVGLSATQRARIPGRRAKRTFFKRGRSLANEETNASESGARRRQSSDLCLRQSEQSPGDRAFA